MPVEDIAGILARPPAAVRQRAADRPEGREISLASGRAWTVEEKAMVAKLYPTMSAKEISQLIQRTLPAVYACITKLGIERQNRRWTPENDAELARLYPTTPTDELAEMLSRSRFAVICRVRLIGVIKEGISWSAEADDKLARLYPYVPAEEIAQILGRTPTAVRSRASELGVRKAGHFWTAEEEATLIRNYFKMPVEDIAKIIKKSPRSVSLHASYIGLRKVKIWRHEEDMEIEKLRPIMSIKNIASYLGRTYASVAGRRQRIRQYEKPLTSEETAELLRLYPKMSSIDIAKRYGRALHVIRAAAAENGLKKFERWSRLEDKILTELYPDIPAIIISKMIGRSISAIHRHAKILGITVAHAQDGHASSHKYTMWFLQREIVGLDHEAHEKFGRKRYLLRTRMKRNIVFGGAW
jgi:hypothetical protein